MFWERSSDRLAARSNLAIWLEYFAAAIFAVGWAAGIALFALRRVAGPVCALEGVNCHSGR
jgi:hypothetical protein